MNAATLTRTLTRALTRTLAMIRKELLAALRDPKARIVLVVPPIIQLVLFAYAATLEVKNVAFGIYNLDDGPAAVELMQQVSGSPNFRHVVMLHSLAEMREQIDQQRIIGALMIDESFSRDVAAHRPAVVYAALDGRRSNSAQIVGAYLSAIVGATGASLRPDLIQPGRGGGTLVRHMFNPNLDFILFVLPTLVATVAAMAGLSVTSQSVAREREIGSFDQLMVSPLRLPEILVGKMTPPLLIGLCNVTAYLLILRFVFGEALQGSLVMYYLSLTVFMAANIGIGMMVSAIAQTQQQAFLGVFVVLVPMNLLSGLTAPIDNMPVWLQWIAQANPLKHEIVILEGLFLKAMPAGEVLANCLPLALIATVTLTISTLMFRSRTE